MASKRSHSTEIGPSSSRDEQDAAKRPRTTDPYCWLCHQNDTNVDCNTCQRSYHETCIGTKPKKKFSCHACLREDLARSNDAKWPERSERLSNLLAHITKRLKSEEFKVLSDNYWEDKLPANSGIVNAFDLLHIRDKVQSEEYQTPLQFLNDIRWIKHNIIASDNVAELPIAKRLEQFCKKEVYDIEMCVDCFERSNTQDDWFTEVCNPPHLLVWARESGHRPFKPAKVIGLGNKVTKKIDVRFFGDHVMADVSISDCYLFSKEFPGPRTDEKNRLALIKCLAEVDKYIENIMSTFDCSVKKADRKMPFNIDKMAEQLTNMVPELTLPVDYQLKMKPIYLNPPQRRRGPSRRKIQKRTSSQNSTVTIDKMKQCCVVLQNCDYLVNRYKRKDLAVMDHDYATDRDSNDNDYDPFDGMAIEQPTNDGNSDEEDTVLISDDEDPFLKCTNVNHDDSDAEVQKYQPNNHIDTTKIEPMCLSDQTTEEADSDNEIVSNHNDEVTMNISEDSVDDHFAENISSIILDAINDTDDNSMENAEVTIESGEVTIDTTQPLIDDYVVISREEVMAMNMQTANNQFVDENVSVTNVENDIVDEELIDQNQEKISEDMVQNDCNDELNHDETQDESQTIQEPAQNANGIANTDVVVLDESTQTLPPLGKMIEPLAQSTPFKPIVPTAQLTPLNQSENDETVLNAHQEMAKESEDNIAAVQLELKNLTFAYEELEKQNKELAKVQESQATIIERLESQVDALNQEVDAKQTELDTLVLDHAAELLRTIDEIKNKLWCRCCQNEVENPFNGLIVCSAQCLQMLWAKEHETSERSSMNSAIQSVNEGHTDVQSLVDDLSNDQVSTGRPNVQPPGGNDTEDPLAADLSGF